MAITRVTYFKVPKAADRQALVSLYRAMPTKALKILSPSWLVAIASLWLLTTNWWQNGAPYIRSVKAGPALADARSQGFTFAAISVFDSLEDMQYYDKGCTAHAELRTFAQSVHEGAMVVYFEDALANE
ncbi:stress responsive A/B barrel domain protein [Sporothrix schenckii 1099-18]|uniref:Stress responsive A/B barrel domain protein n=1 Tax=Sporothrix schenckii 1099-18 TaxID=1397361 RepID=A0A0F2LYM4_SPOSC|nr:stress responsive A/B barrel domain protein [Sporothrix schenckii 1099-18]KJR81595.1 stress responsive A/B barrel domain protein [Sporothrix schenckii 1099-18]